MTSLLNVLHQALGDIQSTRYAFLASSSIIVFDHLITLDLEVDLIWKKTWSFGKIMFILNRYYPLISVIFNTYALFSPNLTDNSSTSARELLKWSNLDTGHRFVRWQGWTGLVACMLAETILQMRLYALYSLNKRILALMVSMFFISTSLSAGVMGKILSDLTITAKPFSFIGLEDITFCAPTNISPNFFIFWIPLLVYESILCGLAVYKGYQSFRADGRTLRSGNRILSILIRDSVLYFIIIASAYFSCLLLWILARQSLLEIPIGFTVAMSCVLANRVVLNVREANRSLEEVDIFQVMIDENGVRTHLNDLEMAGLRSLKISNRI